MRQIPRTPNFASAMFVLCATWRKSKSKVQPHLSLLRNVYSGQRLIVRTGADYDITVQHRVWQLALAADLEIYQYTAVRRGRCSRIATAVFYKYSRSECAHDDTAVTRKLTIGDAN